MNLLLIPTLAIGFLLFWAGQVIVAKAHRAGVLMALTIAAFFVGVPGFLFPLYYLHLFDNATWFYEFRSMPFTELLASGAGLFAGMLAGLMKGPKLVSRPFLAAVLFLGIAAPYLKPIVAPVRSSRFIDQWQDDVCLQSTPSSCGPASAATIFRHFGVDVSEKEIARECFTYLGGTENWYLARAFRRRGFKVNYRIESALPRELPVPSIAGVKVGGMGHFIPILSKTETSYVLGDPMVGRKEVDAEEVRHAYAFTGFFMTFGKVVNK